MSIERLPFERRPRNSIANNLDRINELVDWVNQDTHLYASASGERVTVYDASSLKGLAVNGRSVQNGTPTPDAPVPVQVVGSLSMPSNITWKQGGVSTTTGNEGSDENRIHTVMFEIVPGATYTVGVTNSNYLYSVRLFSGTRWITSDFVYGDSTWKSNDDTYANPNARYMSIVIRLSNNENISPSDGDNAGVFATTSCIGLVVGDTTTPIDLQNNVLASLPDGTRDELHVDSAGHVTVEKHVALLDSTTGETWTTTGQINNAGLSVMQADADMLDGIRQETVSRYAVSNIGIQDTNFANTVVEGFGANSSPTTHRVYWRYDPGETAPSVANGIGRMAELGANLYYPRLNPVTIDLGYITPPAIPSGSVVTVSASLTPTFHLEWWVDIGITELVNDLIAYVDYKTEG